MLRAFDEKKIEDFFLDGQTAAIDEYIEVHPEDKEKISQLVTDGNYLLVLLSLSLILLFAVVSRY
jgi:alpha-mannosidase